MGSIDERGSHVAAARKTALGPLIRRYRLERGWTQDQLCFHMNDQLDRSTIGQYENGRIRTPGLDALRLIKATLAIPDDEWNHALWKDGATLPSHASAEGRRMREAARAQRRSGLRERMAYRAEKDRRFLDDRDREMLNELHRIVPALRGFLSAAASPGQPETDETTG